MRKPTISVTERDLMYCIGGQLFSQAPNRQPRKVEILMTKVRDAFRKDAVNHNEWYSLGIEEDKLHKYIHNLLMSIPEFTELNLSYREYMKGVGVNDPNRPKWGFTSAYDVETSNSWESDFIDLDAFIRNVHGNLLDKIDADIDCFGCIHENTKVCDCCSINHSILREGRREPRGNYTIACKHDCYDGRYICCEECSEFLGCTHACTSYSETCGLVAKRVVTEGKNND